MQTVESRGLRAGELGVSFTQGRDRDFLLITSTLFLPLPVSQIQSVAVVAIVQSVCQFRENDSAPKRNLSGSLVAGSEGFCWRYCLHWNHRESSMSHRKSSRRSMSHWKSPSLDINNQASKQIWDPFVLQGTKRVETGGREGREAMRRPPSDETVSWSSGRAWSGCVRFFSILPVINSQTAIRIQHGAQRT